MKTIRGDHSRVEDHQINMRRILVRRKLLFLVVLLSTTSIVLFTILLLDDQRFYAPIRIPHSESSVISKNDSKTILFWTQIFQSDFTEYAKITQPDFTCSDGNQQILKCRITTDHSEYDSSSAVIFHLRDLKTWHVPEYKLKGQKFILYNLESPVYTTNRHRIIFEMFEDNIDWIMTYRSDSDIYVPYGKVVRRSEFKERKSPLELHDLYQTKGRSIAWFVSNCHTASRREDLVTQLQKFIEVDIYGYCGSLSCKRHKENCYEMLEKNYKFYLSFENSICKDYVTEKLFNILDSHVIPIVYGGADYYKILPKDSFIDVRNFSSPQKLADFLRQIESREDLYNSYFKWKDDYSVIHYEYPQQLCEVCKKVHKSSKDQQGLLPQTRDLIKSWYTDSSCSGAYDVA